MKTLINKRLDALAAEDDITILYACESGSRAWGFPSPDSDYDVRFIYVQKPDWYLSLKEGKDTINLPIDEHELDITGWELRKALTLVQKSNASPMEWIQSPIVYQMKECFRADLELQCRSFFSSIATAHHYHSMAMKYVESLDVDGKVKLKSCFYALRTVLCVSWIIEQGTMPPIIFEDMLGLLDENIREKVLELMEVKKAEDETFMYKPERWLLVFLKGRLEINKVGMRELEPGNGHFSELDRLFLTTVKKYA